MDRLLQHNVLAMSGRAVEAAATWTCCCSTKREPSRWAIAKPPIHSRAGRRRKELADAAQLSSLADETARRPECGGVAKKFGIRERQIH